MAVNHFKSKGSQCYNDYVEYEQPVPLNRGRIDTKNAKRAEGFEEDLQGSCNEFRVSAAEVLGEYMRENTAGDVLMLGDYNAYGKEDPVRLLTDYNGEGRKLVTAPYTFIGDQAIDGAQGRELTKGYGYVNLVEHMHGTKAFSYTYAGELGSLDHAIGSGSVVAKLTEATDWHINSAENNMFEYSRRYSGDLEKSDNSFSSSDHDPVILTLDYSLVVAKQVKTEDLPDAKVSVEMQGYKGDTFARSGMARPELPRGDLGKVGLFGADDGAGHLRAYETVKRQGVLKLTTMTTAWALVMDESYSKEELLAMDAYSLLQAKLNVSRRDIVRVAIAIELAHEYGMDSIELAKAVLADSDAQVWDIVLEGYDLSMDKQTMRAKVQSIKSWVKPYVKHDRQDIYRHSNDFAAK